MRWAFLATMPLALSACVAVWGSSYKIESQNSNGVVIRYDAAITATANVQRHADEICGDYRKVAVAKDQRRGVLFPGGSMTEISFLCETVTEARKDRQLFDAQLSFSAVPVPATTTSFLTVPSVVAPSMPQPILSAPHDLGYLKSMTEPRERPAWCPPNPAIIFAACP